MITLVGFKLSGQKPDTDHPFGHGRMEYISGLLVSVAILIMGFELIRSSIAKIRTPEPIESSPVILGVLVASILVKVYMYHYNRTCLLYTSIAATISATGFTASQVSSVQQAAHWKNR